MQPAHDRPFPAHLLDGRSALPARGTVRIERDVLRFAPNEGARMDWPIGDVTSIERVADEIHLALPPLAAGLPAARLTVEDRAFEETIDEAQRRFADGPGRAVRRATRKIGLRAWIVIAAVVLPLGFVALTVGLPRLHVLVPYDKEAALGEAVYEALGSDWTPLESEEFARVVAPMVEELRDPDLPFDLRVSLVDMDIPNAVALPGGRILIFRGTITSAPSPDALAGVLAHEIVHVEQRHSLKHILRSLGLLQFATSAVGGGIDGFEAAETMVEVSSGLLILRHSRAHESEADEIAVQKLRAVGRNARGIAQFFSALQDEMGEDGDGMTWLSTHPATSERIARVERLAAGGVVRPGTRPWMTQEEWEDFQALFAE